MQAEPRAAGEPPLPRGLPGPRSVARAARDAPHVAVGGTVSEFTPLAYSTRLGAADARVWET